MTRQDKKQDKFSILAPVDFREAVTQDTLRIIVENLAEFGIFNEQPQCLNVDTLLYWNQSSIFHHLSPKNTFEGSSAQQFLHRQAKVPCCFTRRAHLVNSLVADLDQVPDTDFESVLGVDFFQACLYQLPVNATIF